MNRVFHLSLSCLLLFACAESLAPNDGIEPPPGGDRITTVDNQDGTKTTSVDATSEEEWVFLDLETGKEVKGASEGWDLAFKRIHIVGNGTAGVRAAWVAGKELDETLPEESAFETEPTERSEVAIEEGAFQLDDSWYVYNPINHTLSPRERIYFVESGEGKVYALRILDYYDEARTSGHVSFLWAPAETQDVRRVTTTDNGDGTKTTVVDASSDDEWVFFDLETGAEVDDEEEWDLAFQRTSIVGNGVAEVAIAWIDGEDLEAAIPVEEEFAVEPADLAESAQGAFMSGDKWYAYNPTTHVVSPRERVWFVESSEGKLYALHLVSYNADDVSAPRPTFVWAPVEREVEVPSRVTTTDNGDGTSTTVVDAGSEDEWVFFDLETGAEVDDEGTWDLAFKRTTIVGNGAAEVAIASIEGDDLTSEIPDQVDFIGEPDELAESAQGAFMSGDKWYSYNPMNHVVSPREHVWFVESGEGNLYALHLLSYNEADVSTARPTFLWQPVAR